ncbi:ATP-binding cassette domain-containing protein [Polycladidibacter stylochi]|uniref:ATP-binding cassette domain-containing protein n=1 Tax=Polycladidibacter stylochi TaxID=1807766 RepID=UPI00082CCD40|nr:ATP-binding cassette domain-containing protein [Pseudovibrio stylochi]
MTIPFLKLDDVRVYYENHSPKTLPWQRPLVIKAVDGISFELDEGETLGIVGESGSGKSTLARTLLQLVPVYSGAICFSGQDLVGASSKQMRRVRRDIQMVFQDPLASLNPRLTAEQIISEPLRTHFPKLSRQEVKGSVHKLMERVGLQANMCNRYPHEFSGGQCQRIGIARALITNPRLLVCDEPVSALDVSVQAQVLDLLQELQRELSLSMLFIAHDISVVRQVSDRIMVMHHGRMVECGPSSQIIDEPREKYTRELIAAIPIPDPVLEKQRLAQRSLAAPQI